MLEALASGPVAGPVLLVLLQLLQALERDDERSAAMPISQVGASRPRRPGSPRRSDLKHLEALEPLLVVLALAVIPGDLVLEPNQAGESPPTGRAAASSATVTLTALVSLILLLLAQPPCVVYPGVEVMSSRAQRRALDCKRSIGLGRAVEATPNRPTETAIADSPARLLPGEADAPPSGGVGLCLSGGGYRAMLFHLGALWRLNEASWLRRLDWSRASLAARPAPAYSPWHGTGSASRATWRRTSSRRWWNCVKPRRSHDRHQRRAPWDARSGQHRRARGGRLP